ncbi:MAG: hypothetical protein AAGM46_23975 [Cyanobacteria bacterium J06582_2]
MSSASSLYERYSIGKTYFYQRRDYLIELGYNMEAEKNGRKKNYTDDQIKLLDALHAHINETGGMDGFPQAEPIAENPTAEQAEGNGLVHAEREEIEVDESTTDVYVDTNPLADIQEQQLASVDVAAQYSAAQNLTAFNYLTVDYMKHRDFSVQELAEEVHKSEQAVRKTFDSMMENPASATKKILARVRRQRKNAIA